MLFLKKIIVAFPILTCKKLVNLCVLKVDFFISKYFKHLFMGGRISSLAVEPTNCCQLSCVECPSGNQQLTRPKGSMSLDDFKTIVNEVSDTLLNLTFYFQGEPFLNKDAIPCIAYAVKKKIFVNTSTNAQSITPELAKEIVQSGLQWLIISLDGYNQTTYEQYRRGGSFEQVLKAMDYINEAKKELHALTPIVEVQCLLLATTEHYKKEVKAIAMQQGADQVSFKTAQFYNFQYGHPLMPHHEKNCRYRKMSNGLYELKTRHRSLCWRAWSSVVVTWNLDVLPCCFDKDARCSYGNIPDCSLKDVRKSTAFAQFSRKMLKNRYQFSMCNNCTE